jgi:hypothetical protein
LLSGIARTSWQSGKSAIVSARQRCRDCRTNATRTEAVNVARLDYIEKRIGALDQRLKSEFPDYAALVSPTPLSVADVQALIGRDEALVLFLDTPEWEPTPEETFVWVVTKSDLNLGALQPWYSCAQSGKVWI